MDFNYMSGTHPEGWATPAANGGIAVGPGFSASWNNPFGYNPFGKGNTSASGGAMGGLSFGGSIGVTGALYDGPGGPFEIW